MNVQKHGNQYSGSSPGDEAEIHNRHKYEFRFLAAHRGLFEAVLANYKAQSREITRATLLADIQDSNLGEQSSMPGNVSSPPLAPNQPNFGSVTYRLFMASSL